MNWSCGPLDWFPERLARTWGLCHPTRRPAGKREQDGNDSGGEVESGGRGGGRGKKGKGGQRGRESSRDSGMKGGRGLDEYLCLVPAGYH